MNRYLATRLEQLLADATEQMRQNPTSVNDRFRVKSYRDAIAKIEACRTPIAVESDIPLNPKSKIYAKVVSFMGDYAANALNAVDTEVRPYERLKMVSGIGEAKARALVDTHGIHTIEELRNHPELLNDKQRIGLRHYEHEQQRIPRHEIETYEALFIETMRQIQRRLRIQEPWNMSINGSFRRGAPDSGDIDCLISSDSHTYYEEFIRTLQTNNYLCSEDTLAHGDKKYMGYIQIAPSAQGTTPRRIDIIYCPLTEFPFAQLYFTGSGAFNIRMREHAKKRGYRLNEKGLTPTLPNVAPVPSSILTERDIFTFLSMEYVEPSQRV